MMLFLLLIAEIADVLLQQANIRVNRVRISVNTTEKRQPGFTVCICNK